VKKAGHAGTLDPDATGLMLICLEESTKAMPVLMGLPKEYVGVMRLHKNVYSGEIRGSFKNFMGVVKQMPPVKSAVSRRERVREIYSLEILEIKGRDVKFKVRCEAGTYIRKLAHDIGVDLGCGAQLTELRRTKIGTFSIEEAVSFSDVGHENVVPLELVLDQIKLKRVVVKDCSIKKIRNGAPVKIQDLLKIDHEIKKNEHVGIFNEIGEIIALGTAKMDYNKMKCVSVNVIKTDRIFN
jgi:H/ACA ribonucleoprotein complex subunit 4